MYCFRLLGTNSLFRCVLGVLAIMFHFSSLHSVISLLYEGAEEDSKTKKELLNFLGGVTNPTLLRNTYQDLMATFAKEDQVVMRNDLYITFNHTAELDYAKTIHDNYYAGFSYFNKTDEKLAVDKINKIISDQTRGYIPRALDSLQDADMFITNTLFLKVSWAMQFLRTRSPMEFTKVDGSIINVPAFEAESSNIKVNSFIVGYKTLEETSSSQPENAMLTIIRIPYAGEEGEQSDLEFRIYLGQWWKNKNRKDSHNYLMTALKDSQTDVFRIKLDEYQESDNLIKIQIPVFKTKSKFRVEEFLIDRS